MANTFKNASGEATTGGLAVYTVPASTTSVIIGINLANKVAAQVTASVKLGTAYIIKDVPIPAGGAFSPLDGKLIATAGQALTVYCSAASSLDAIVSVLEQS